MKLNNILVANVGPLLQKRHQVGAWLKEIHSWPPEGFSDLQQSIAHIHPESAQQRVISALNYEAGKNKLIQ